MAHDFEAELSLKAKSYGHEKRRIVLGSVGKPQLKARREKRWP